MGERDRDRERRTQTHTGNWYKYIIQTGQFTEKVFSFKFLEMHFKVIDFFLIHHLQITSFYVINLYQCLQLFKTCIHTCMYWKKGVVQDIFVYIYIYIYIYIIVDMIIKYIIKRQQLLPDKQRTMTKLWRLHCVTD